MPCLRRLCGRRAVWIRRKVSRELAVLFDRIGRIRDPYKRRLSRVKEMGLEGKSLDWVPSGWLGFMGIGLGEGQGAQQSETRASAGEGVVLDFLWLGEGCWDGARIVCRSTSFPPRLIRG